MVIPSLAEITNPLPAHFLRMVIPTLAETTNPLPVHLSQGSPQESQASAEPETQLSQCLLLGL